MTSMIVEKLSKGHYVVVHNDEKFSLFRYDSGDWKGWWVYYNENHAKNEYSDPVETKKVALEQLKAKFKDEQQKSNFGNSR